MYTGSLVFDTFDMLGTGGNEDVSIAAPDIVLFLACDTAFESWERCCAIVGYRD